MGWKNVKEKYKIEHIVCVTSDGICIGSPYIHDILVIGFDGVVKKWSDSSNESLRRYQNEFKNNPEELKNLVISPDRFEKFVKVYTYKGGEIIETYCEELDWPNVTHDGHLMFENTFSYDKQKVIQWAIENAILEIKFSGENIEKLKKELRDLVGRKKKSEDNLKKLKKYN